MDSELALLLSDEPIFLGKGVAGVDEVGRGPLVGDVVAAAVILDPEHGIEGLADSKKLSEKRRITLAEQIKARSVWAIGIATPAEIDQINILHASLLAMQRAVDALDVCPNAVLVDGNRTPKLLMPAKAVVKGDSKVAQISAASILAKVYRDQQMVDLDAVYPQYRFAKHKGYPTAEHLSLIEEYGIIAEHRRSFGPVKRIIQEG